MQDYLDSGHMDLVKNPVNNLQSYYIPHHCVIKPDSVTTKLRVVFDAAAKTSENLSLNDTMFTGPKLQNDIFSILCRFRVHPYVFTADIKQMYRQILICQQHQPYQRILWRFDPSDPVQVFQLKTVTYGTSSAPFLALRTLVQLAKDETNNFPWASNVLLSDVYVDDIVTGCATITDACELRMELVNLLSAGGFELRKWASNHPDILKNIPDAHCQTAPLSFDSDSQDIVKILGLQWNPYADSFSYNVQPMDRSCTKRNLLSEVARIFDPIGFLAPLTFFAKFLIQRLWSLGLDWDESPPPDICLRWQEYKTQLSLLPDLQVPRFLFSPIYNCCDLHGFCDASELGYAAVIYMRLTELNQTVKVQLLCAKSKVAPLKRISIPRLELCAAVLLAKLLDLTVNTYKGLIVFDKIYGWSDSTVTLAWIRSSPHRWKTFVANRVTQVHQVQHEILWNHVRSEDNPADCASRGLLPKDLINHPLWWAGSPILYDPSLTISECLTESHWTKEILQEERITVLTTQITYDLLDSLINRFSSLRKIQGIIAYCLRFVANCKQSSRVVSPLLSAELDQALRILIKHTQATVFANEITSLNSQSSLPKYFKKLVPFLDEMGVLRVGGRLINSTLPYDAKHPILLPSTHRLTNLIIDQFHRKYLHPGCQTLHFLLRQQFWILSPRKSINRIVSKCIKCWRLNPPIVQPRMGNLPALRLCQLKPFVCVGVDYGGPFRITLSKTRGAKTLKAYICLFVCFSTKALHIELASDLTSDAFLAALRRFIARRGRCSHIYSDCGTNFVGAHKQILELMEGSVNREGLQWHFNPPSAPHFGGLWEAGIKSVKTHLYRVIGEQVLTYEELSTVLAQIEALLNSRPLCPLSSDPNDMSVLTPGHFLSLEPLSALPESDLTEVPLNRLSRWQLLQRLHQNFWSRWHREYVHTLQQRSKWTTPSTPIELNTIVLIKNNLVPPMQWSRARVVAVHPGADNEVRVVTLRTYQQWYDQTSRR